MSWPDDTRPGVPMNPERDGAHVVRRKLQGTERVLCWDAERGAWLGMRAARAAHLYDYLGPCLTYAEAAAKAAASASEARLREALQQLVSSVELSEFDHNIRIAQTAMRNARAALAQEPGA